MSKPENYRNRSLSEQLGILGYAYNQEYSGALKYLDISETEKDGFGTDATKYVNKVKRALG